MFKTLALIIYYPIKLGLLQLGALALQKHGVLVCIGLHGAMTTEVIDKGAEIEHLCMVCINAKEEVRHRLKWCMVCPKANE